MNHILMTYIVLPVVAFATGGAVVYFNRPAPEVQIQVQEKVVERLVQGEETVRTVVRDRIVTRTVTQKPDGTTITEDTDKSLDREKQQETQIVVREKVRDLVRHVPAAAARYSLGVSYWPDYRSLLEDSRQFQQDKLEVSSGLRLIGGIWMDLGVRKDSFGLGLRWEF